MSNIHVGDTVFQNMDDQEMTVTKIIHTKDKDIDTKGYLKKGYKEGDVVCSWREGSKKRESAFPLGRITRL